MLAQQTPIAFSGNIPQNYDAFLGPMFFEPYALEMSKRISKLAPANLLELASGTGRLTRMLPASSAENATIIASDINPAMIQFGKNRTQFEKIQWMEIDAVSLPQKDSSMDCIVVQFGVMFYSDRVKAFKEALRVLKPGGVMLFSCWDIITNNPIAQLTNETLKHFFPIDTPAFYKVPFSYYDEDLITDELEEAGFDKIKIEIVQCTGESKSAADAAKGLTEGSPVIVELENRASEKVSEIREYMQKKITEQFGATALQVPLSARIVTVQKAI
ncbi:MAG: class I SAM-dependent methyltransferase [Bacteroidetes bacterium]|jgi:ubiquinone/menaquinone biosynthesis C-methylase UbiE|nr:class I SAM-dependent methyltransferase [Bacteroidota bacterium]MBK9524599.1 class I SAM-dependent methyltransferase [Bacteroidota bacterium]MBK9542056.1 class I SAM-dependent methyltransferase [Bacteroidota bacterium]MBP6401018.1 class I SAM-dependent methyltransferase [Bacteroidia bacterium]MBP6648034.1 class I SAM-dependent methyltransferase [Bacteroidia bacterium]